MQVKTLGLLGTGVIGAGWAARALHFGIDVVAADVKPEMEGWLRDAVANAEPALARLTLAPLPPKGVLSFTTSLAEMAAQGRLHPGEHPGAARAQAADAGRGQPAGCAGRDHRLEHVRADADATCSATCSAPERFCVAHPFNPVYLLPLVELVGGQQTVAADDRCARRLLHVHRHAPAARAARGPRTPHGPAAGGAVARDPAHRQRRRRDHGRTRRIDHLRSRPALGRHGHQPHLPPGRRRNGHAAHAGAVRPVPEVAVDQARSARTHRGTDRPHGGGHAGPGGRALDPRTRAAA